MAVEKDVNIQLWRENGGGSACSRTSILTRKSAYTPRVGQTDGRSTRSSISSRARQIKDYEGDPFLSIDVLPETNSQSSFRKDSSTRRYSGKTREHSYLTTSSGRHTFSNSYGQDDDLSGVFSRYVSVMRPASLTSQARFPQLGHVFARLPFKQAADVPGIEKTRMMSASPGRSLMESTTLAVHIVNEILNEQKHQETTHTPGRLLKARLKNLDPVMVDGPTICQCRGITTERRTPLVCNRRTYHRLMTMLSKAHSSKDIAQDSNGFNKPVSVHQTSEASSLDSGISAAFITHHDLDEKHILQTSAEKKQLVNM